MILGFPKEKETLNLWSWENKQNFFYYKDFRLGLDLGIKDSRELSYPRK
jgi:hypothetical protein